jgi:hypothetical protein
MRCIDWKYFMRFVLPLLVQHSIHFPWGWLSVCGLRKMRRIYSNAPEAPCQQSAKSICRSTIRHHRTYAHHIDSGGFFSFFLCVWLITLTLFPVSSIRTPASIFTSSDSAARKESICTHTLSAMVRERERGAAKGWMGALRERRERWIDDSRAPPIGHTITIANRV